MLAAHILSGGAHRRLDRLARRVHEELGEPFKDLLNLLGIGSLQVLGGELHANVADTSGDFAIRL